MSKEREVLELALEALETAWYHVGTFCPTEEAIELYDEARAAIKKALAQPPLTENGIYQLGYHNGYGFGEAYAKEQMAQRKPLTDEQIDDLAEHHGLDCMVYEPFARAIEAAHGIKGEQ